MNLATRILGVAIFVSVLAGATYAAFQGFETEPQLGASSVEIQQPEQIPDLVAGQQAPIALSLQNNGERETNVTLASDTDGFTFQGSPSMVTVPAGEETRANGLLGADNGIEGAQDVTIVATDNATGNELDDVTFQVNVTPPTPPELTIEPVLPAVLPGEEATFQASLSNTVSARQTIDLSLPEAEGTIDPQQVTLQPDGTGAATVTVPVPQDASGTFGFDLVATNDANQTATASASVPVVADGEIAVEPLQSSFEVREGNRYTVPVAIVSNADVAGEVTATGDAVVATNFTALEPESSTGGFVTLEAPGEATEQQIEVSVDDRTETVTVDVGPVSDGPTPGEGEQAELRHTARLPNGTVVETAVPGIAQGSFPKSQYFQEGQGAQPLTVRMGGAGGAPPGVASAAANMTEGESLTITLAPEDAYGPERRTQDLEATTELQREIEFDRRPDKLQDFPRNRLPDAFDLEGKEEGDIVDFEQDVGDETIVLRFKILSLSEDTVSLERYAEEGETTTFYPAWPNATEVVSVTDETITYRSTPPDSASEEPFAWDQDPNSHQAKWGNTTTVDEMNETAIVLLHQPEEGIEYNVSSRFGQERSYRVEDVTQDTITVSTPNQDPRGGETVTFDLTLVDISEAQQRGLPPGLGGG